MSADDKAEKVEEVEEEDIMAGPSDDETKKGSKFRWRGTAYHLTYKSHIPHEDLLDHVLEKTKRPDYKAYSIVHETSDKDTPYEHTHLLFVFDKKMEHKNSGLLDYKDIHPHIRNVPMNRSTRYCHNIFNYHKKAPVLLEQVGQENIKTPAEISKENWGNIRDLAKEGKVVAISEQYPNYFFSSYNAIRHFASVKGKVDVPDFPDVSDTCHMLFWSEKGSTGKSTTAKTVARDIFGGYYLMDSHSCFLQNYCFEDCIIIDEFNRADYLANSAFFKQLVDVGKVNANIKYGGTFIRPKSVIICMNGKPEDIFGDEWEHIWKQRFARVREFKEVLVAKKKHDENLLAKFDAKLAEIFGDAGDENQESKKQKLIVPNLI